MSVYPLEIFQSAPGSSVGVLKYDALKKYDNGGSGSSLRMNGSAFVVQVKDTTGGTYFPKFAYTSTDDKVSKVCLNIMDPELIEKFTHLDNYLLENFIAQSESVFPKVVSKEAIRLNYNPMIKEGGEKTDGSHWPAMLRLKYKMKDGVAQAVIKDCHGHTVDPSSLYGRRCKRLLIHISIIYSAGKAYGTTLNLIRMEVTDSTLDTTWDFIEEDTVEETCEETSVGKGEENTLEETCEETLEERLEERSVGKGEDPPEQKGDTKVITNIEQTVLNTVVNTNTAPPQRTRVKRARLTGTVLASPSPIKVLRTI